MIDTNHKRIAMNTAIMYARMLLVMCISFYSSRLLLSTLGITDFGILSVVGSITVTFAAIKGLFSESVQRFLNVAKGKEGSSLEEQRKIFYMSNIIHVALSVIFIIVVECVGLWLLNNYLDIPEDRFNAACFVFHISVIATAISIISIPYDAVVIANERMSFYAIISLFDSILKLIFIIILPIIGWDYLKTYSLFILFVPISTLVLQFIYCRQFPECSYKVHFDKSLLKSMLHLSSWNFFGNLCFSLIHEGINMLLNFYGGVVMNASRAIAYQVKSLANQVSNNTLVAIRPRVMQHSVQKDRSHYFDDIFLLSRLSFFTLALIIFPLYTFCPNFLQMWLGEYPESAIPFTRLVLIAVFLRSLHEPINLMNMAFAKIKRQILIESFIMLLSFGAIYLSFQLTNNSAMPFIILSIMEILVMIGLLINANIEVEFPLYAYLTQVIFPMIILSLMSIITGFLIHKLVFIDNLVIIIISAFIYVIIELAICFILLNKRERGILNRLIKRS